MLNLLRRYGNSSDEGLRLIGLNPRLNIKWLLEFPEASHDISYFNIRRPEMLPPNFVDSRTKDIIRPHEVDNFIELELKLNTKVRSSLRQEAGDVIDDLTGLSYDPMGLKPSAINAWTKNGTESVNYWFGGFENSISHHFKKITDPDTGIPPLDFVVIDYKYFDEISITVGQDANYLKDKIDQYLLQHHNQHANQLIKLNYQ